jgi:hypothetical protein
MLAGLKPVAHQVLPSAQLPGSHLRTVGRGSILDDRRPDETICDIPYSGERHHVH